MNMRERSKLAELLDVARAYAVHSNGGQPVVVRFTREGVEIDADPAHAVVTPTRVAPTKTVRVLIPRDGTEADALTARGFDTTAFVTAHPELTDPLGMLSFANALASGVVVCALGTDGTWPAAVIAVCQQNACEEAMGAGATVTGETADGYSYSTSAPEDVIAAWTAKLVAAAGCNDADGIIGVPCDTRICQ